MMPIMRDLRARRDELEERADFIKCAAMIMLNRDKSAAAAMAKAAKLSARAQEVLTKAASPAATLSGVGISNFGSLIGSFMASVRNIGAFDTIAGFAMPMPLAPGRVVIGSTIASSAVNEGAAKPIRAVSFGATDFSPIKIVSLVVLSAELIEGLTDEGLRALDRELRNSVALGADTSFLSALSGNSSEAMGQPTFAGFVDDLTELLRFVSVGARSRLFLILHPDTAKAVAPQALNAGLNIAWNGGSLAGVEILVSDAQTAGRATLVDATGLAIGQKPIELRNSSEATVEMDTAPSGNSATPTAVQLVSLWQTNSRGLKAEREIAVKPIRPNSYAHLTNVAFPAVDSPIA